MFVLCSNGRVLYLTRKQTTGTLPNEHILAKYLSVLKLDCIEGLRKCKIHNKVDVHFYAFFC